MPFDLERIGHVLKTTREERGLTIEQVAQALFIRKRMLTDLESGDWDRLPHPVYVKGYINQSVCSVPSYNADRRGGVRDKGRGSCGAGKDFCRDRA